MWRRFAAASTVAVTAFTLGAPAEADANEVLDDTIIAMALAGVSDRLAGPTLENADEDSIASNSTIDVRRDGTIRIQTENAGDIVITLPYVDSAVASNGGATYSSADAAAVTRLTASGAQTLLVAASEFAPTAYPFQVINGYVSSTPSGGLTLLDHNGLLVMPIPAPWAEDANGQAIRTSFHVKADRTGFTQTIEHQKGAAYPVVADPWMSYQAIRMWPNNQKVGDRFTVYFDRFETANMAGAGTSVALALLTRAGVPANWVSFGSGFAIAGARQAAYQSGKCATIQLDIYWGWLPYGTSWARAC